MATLTVDRFLDAAAVTAGEVFTMNGARLTIRTDTRYHANSPASFTGAIGGLTISSTLGGGVTIDGRNVRWMPYNTGTGNVPAINTSITQGGVTGILLGVWATLVGAPTAVGAAMPATGFIKFREVTSGPFTAGALTGIGASATGPDVVGWIEVVCDTAVTHTVPRLGDFTVRGAWFELGTTTGVANQLVDIPRMGSTTAYTPGVWISKNGSPTTDEDWEFYPSIYAVAMIAANLGTDVRSKFVCMETNGQIRIGHNGTTSIGYLPPAGRKIRICNVFGRQALAASRATSVLPSATATTRPDFVTTNAGVIDLQYFATDWYLNFAQAYSLTVRHSCTFDWLYGSEIAAPIDIYNGGSGMSQTLDARSFNLTSCFAGGTIQKWNAPRHLSGTNDHAFEILNSIGQSVIDCDSGIVTFARSTGMAFHFGQSYDLTVNNCRAFNSSMQFTTCFNCTVNDLDFSDRYVGTTTTTGIYAFLVNTACDGITIDGLTFGLNGTVANVHPYLGVLNYSTSKNIKLRNLGTRAAFLSGGSANNPAYIALSGGNNQNVKFQRCYMLPTRTGLVSTLNSDKNVTYEHCYGDFADSTAFADLNSKVKNCGLTNNITGQASVYGTHFLDIFTSNTAGRLILSMNERTTETTPYVALVAGTPKFTSVGSLVLAAVNDEVIFEMDYFALGHTSFANAAPVITGTNVTFSSGPTWGNHNIYYQIDKGTGYGGSWIAFNQTNLFAEAGFSASIGFKMKIRVVCATANTANLLTFIRFDTVSTLSAQTDNLYPLDVATIVVDGLVAGSRVKAFKISDGTVLFNGAETSGTVQFTTEYIGTVSIEARKASGSPYYQPWVTQVTTASDTTVTATALQQLDQ